MLLQDVEKMSEDILTLVRLVYEHTHNRQTQHAEMKSAIPFLGVINTSEGLADVKVSKNTQPLRQCNVLSCNIAPACKQTVCWAPDGAAFGPWATSYK